MSFEIRMGDNIEKPKQDGQEKNDGKAPWK